MVFMKNLGEGKERGANNRNANSGKDITVLEGKQGRRGL